MKRLILITIALLISASATPGVENNSIAYFKRGMDWQKKGDYDLAIANYTKAIELNPNFAMAYNNRGVAYIQGKGNYDQAISDLSKALEIDPRYADAFHNRAFAYYRKGEYGKAGDDLRMAESLGSTVRPEFIKDLLEASELKDEQLGDLLGPEKAFDNNIDTQEECEAECRRMSEKGELRQGMTVEECIMMLLKLCK
jgi:tetratricopeptide (TPR) repeat protein